MEVILLETITNLGNVGDAVHVKPGYARNYLFPTKKAVRASPEAIEMVNKRRQELLKQAKELLDVAQARAELAVKELVFERSVIDAEGRLFGSVAVTDIVEGAMLAGTELQRSEVILPDGVIKTVGEFEVTIVLHPEVSFDMKIIVNAENPEILAADDSDKPAEAVDEADSDAADQEESTTDTT